MKKVFALILVMVIAIGSLSSCALNETQNSDTRTVVGLDGQTVTIPQKINKYAVVWTSVMDIAAMLDGYEHISAYSDLSLKYEMVNEYYSDVLSKATPLPKENISVESIVASGAQVVFIKKSDYKELVSQLEKVSIPVVDMTFENYDELKEAVNLFAEVLGTPEAKQKASLYSDYVDTVLQETSDALTNNDYHQQTAIVFRDAVDYTAYGKARMTGFWIDKCNLKYAVEQDDNTKNINLTKEQLLEYDPDYIFFVFEGNTEVIMNDSNFKSLKAVKNNHVYDIPIGLESFGVKGAECVLQLYWVSSIINSNTVDENTLTNIKGFYNTFYGIELSDDEIYNILDIKE